MEPEGSIDTIEQDIDEIVTDEQLELAGWGLPMQIMDQYIANGITKMFRWQARV